MIHERKNKKIDNLDILKDISNLEERYYLLNDDLLDLKEAIDKIKITILDNNTSDSDSSNSDIPPSLSSKHLVNKVVNDIAQCKAKK